MDDDSVKTLLDKVVSWVKDTGRGHDDRKAPWSWIVTVVVSAVTLFTVGFLKWKASKQAKELAQLKHQRDVEEQRKILHTTVSAVSRNADRSKELWESAMAAGERVKQLDVKIGILNGEWERAKNDINSVENWRDIDRLESD